MFLHITERFIRDIMRKSVVTFCILFFTSAVSAQSTDEAVSAIKKLNFLAGVWKGRGWIGTVTNKEHFNETETARIRVGGTLIQIDVFGTSVTNDSLIINNGLAIVNYNPVSRNYDMKFYQADASYAEAELKIIKPGTVEINLIKKSGFTRFVIEIKNAHWLEKAFSSTDGKNWQQVFEMDLTQTQVQ